MQMQAKYLMKEPSVVPSNYQKAEQLLTEAVNNIQALAFYLLGDLYYHSKYGRRNVEKAKECYINFINEEYCYDRYPYEYGQACHNAASILIDYDGSKEALQQARSILSEARSHNGASAPSIVCTAACSVKDWEESAMWRKEED